MIIYIYFWVVLPIYFLKILNHDIFFPECVINYLKNYFKKRTFNSISVGINLFNFIDYFSIIATYLI